MSKNPQVNNKPKAIYLPKSSKNIKLNFNYRETYTIFTHYDKNRDCELDSEEIEAIKNDMRTYSQNGKTLNLNTYAKMLKSGTQVLKDFLYRLDGNLIGNEIKGALEHKISWFDKPEIAEKFIYKINPNNVNHVNYTFSDMHKSASLGETILNKFPYEKAKKMLSHLANVSSQSLKQANISSKTILEKFNNAMQTNDKEGMLKYLQLLTNMLDYHDVNHLAIAEHHEQKPNAALNSESKKKLSAINPNPNNKDIVGDGKLNNTESYAQTRNTEKVLLALNKALQDPIFKEVANSCVSKEKNYLSTLIPKTKGSYNYNENEMVALMGKYGAPIGDGDTANFVLAILSEAKEANFDIKNASPNEIKKFIKGLFLL